MPTETALRILTNTTQAPIRLFKIHPGQLQHRKFFWSIPVDVGWTPTAMVFPTGGRNSISVIGVPLCLLLGRFPVMRYILDPPIMAIYATPHLALLPIIIVWLGIGMQSKIAVAFVSAVIPILVNTMAGVRGVERSWILAARSFCAGELEVFTKVIMPASLPSVILGIRLGLSRAVLGVVVGEMYQSQAGVGNEIMRYGSEFRTDYLLFEVLLVSLFGLAATSAVRTLEEKLWTAGR